MKRITATVLLLTAISAPALAESPAQRQMHSWDFVQQVATTAQQPQQADTPAAMERGEHHTYAREGTHRGMHHHGQHHMHHAEGKHHHHHAKHHHHAHGGKHHHHTGGKHHHKDDKAQANETKQPAAAPKQ